MWEKNKKAVILSAIIVFALGIFLFIRVAGSDKINEDSQVMSADPSAQEESGASQENNDLNGQQTIVMDEVVFDDSDAYESILLVQGQDEAHMLFVVRTVEGETLTFDAPEDEYIMYFNHVYLADLNGDGADEIVVECAQMAYYFGAYIIDVSNQCFLEVPHTSQDSYEVGVNYDVLAVDENSIKIINEDTGYCEIVSMGRTEILEWNHFSELSEEKKKDVLASLRGYGDGTLRIGASMEMNRIYIIEYEGRKCLSIRQNLMVLAFDRNSTMGHMETVLSYDSQGNCHIEKQTYLENIYTFQQRDIAVVPEVQEYSFEDAVQTEEVWEIDGRFPAAGMGTWYIIDVDGVEYYYGKYDTTDPDNYYYERYNLFGWAIVDDSYELANGIKVGMNESDILEQYPNMAVIDFDDNFVYGGVNTFMGWNGGTYPNSDIGDDSDWDYKGKDYHWTDRFDHVMVADIDLNGEDTLPIYLGLLIKDKSVAAITFYYPTAG